MSFFSTRSRTPLASIAVAALAAVAMIPAASARGAPIDQTVFADESFSGETAPGFLAPAVPSGVNSVCLTAGTDPSATPIPGCAADAAGDGVLRLTDVSPSQAGGIGSTASVPISKGLDVSFTSFQWGGTEADGMTLYLAATDPFAPEVPTSLGALGGSLGYSAQSGTTPGLANGYLGVGLDYYGNFVRPEFQGSGCGFNDRTPNSVSVRGPGNGTVGYCNLSINPVDGWLRGWGDRASAAVPVEVVINPSTESITARENAAVSVAAGTYAVIVTSVDGTTQTFASALPSTLNGLIPAGLYDPSWIDPETGYPYKLTFGFTGGTGGQHDYHEVSDVLATTALGAVPALETTITGDQSLAPTRSSTVEISASVSASGGSEDESVTTTTTFPAGFTPTFVTSEDWLCEIDGQVETCVFDPTSTLAPGATLPALELPYSLSADALSGTIETIVSSVDATSSTASLAVTVAKEATTLDASATQQPGTTGSLTTFTAVVDSPAVAPTGTVDVTDSRSGDVICSAPLVAASGDSQSTASCAGDLPAGATASDIVVSYGGDASHEGSSDTLAAVGVIATSSTIDVTVEVGDDGFVTFRAAVSPSAATGTIDFELDDGTIVCSVVLPEDSCSTTLAAGDYSINARYSGDALFSSSTDSASFTVDAAVVTPDGPAPGDGSLAVTGASITWGILVLIGLLVAAGVILLPRRFRMDAPGA